MKTDPTQTGGSDSETLLAAQDADSQELDKEIIADETADKPIGDRPLSPREEMLARLDAKVDAERIKDVRAAQAEALGLPVEQLPPLEGFDPPATELAGTEPAPTQLPVELQDDPLADFIVMDGEKPMVKIKVDGVERTITLDRARQQLQKHEAAEVRLQQVSEANRLLTEREAQIRQQEATLAARARQPASSPSQSTADVDDQSLEREATDLVNSLFTSEQGEAAAKMVKVLKGLRAQPSAPVDPDALVARAVNAVRQQMDVDSRQTDASDGYTKFVGAYPDIAADAKLFRYADGLTEEIAKEHPEWKPSAVMLEAGKQTSDWVASLKKAPSTSPQPNDRLVRKQTLRAMPPSRTAAKAATETPAPETPHETVAAMRKARGQ